MYPQQLPIVIGERVNEDELDLLLSMPDLVNMIDKKSRAAIAKLPEHLVSDMDRIWIKSDLYSSLQKYKAIRVVNGVRHINYKFSMKAKDGRLFAAGPSLQNFKGCIRKFLTAGVLQDWDMENAHPRFIAGLCAKYDIACPQLDYYVANREEVLGGISGTREEAKTVVLSATYGANMGSFPDPWVRAYAKEMESLVTKLVATPGAPGWEYFQRVKSGKRAKNPKFSAFSKLIQTVENCALRGMVAESRDCKLDVCALAFDGFMTCGVAPADFIDRLNLAVRTAIGFHVPVVEKQIEKQTVQQLAQSVGYNIPELIDDGDMEVDEGDFGGFDDFPDFDESDIMDFSDYETDSVDGDAVPENDIYLQDNAFFDELADQFSTDAGMGMGKTFQSCLRVLHEARQQKTVLWVVQRKLMVDTIQESVNRIDELQAIFAQHGISVSRYDDIIKDRMSGGRINPRAHPFLIVEYESLWRLDVGQYDLVICDEFRSIITTMNSPTNGNHKTANFDRFQSLLIAATTVIYSDADMRFDGACYEFQDIVWRARSDARVLTCVHDARRAREAGLSDAMFLDRALYWSNPAPIKRIDPAHSRICRDVKLVDREAMLWRLRADVLKKRRVGVACGSRKEAEAIREMLSSYTDSIGLFTSESDNKEDLQQLTETWDQFQVIIFTPVITTGADYNSWVHRVFIFPCTGCSTPRDGLQMTGRFRKVHTNQVYAGSKHNDLDKLSAIVTDGESLLGMKTDMLTKIKEAGSLIKSAITDVFSMLRLDLGPKYVGSFQEAPDMLKSMAAFSEVERSFVPCMENWMAMFLHIAESKGYSVENGNHLVPQDAALMAKIGREFSDVLESLKEDDDDLMARLDVSSLASNKADMKLLSAIVADRKVDKKIRALFESKYEKQFGEITFKTLKAALEKAQAARMFPSVDAGELPHLVSCLRKQKRIVRNIEVLNDENKLAIGAAYLRDSKQKEALDLERPHPTMILFKMAGLVSSLGIEWGDYTTPVSKVNAVAQKQWLTELRVLGVVPKGDVHPLKVTQRVLKKELGLVVKLGKPLSFTKDVQDILDRKPAWLPANLWFEETYGVKAPVQGSYEPRITMSDDKLSKIASEFGNVPEFAQEKVLAAQMLAERELARREGRAITTTTVFGDMTVTPAQARP
jgi:hypothetical protein